MPKKIPAIDKRVKLPKNIQSMAIVCTSPIKPKRDLMAMMSSEVATAFFMDGTAGANPFGDPRLIHFVTVSVFLKPPLKDF